MLEVLGIRDEVLLLGVVLEDASDELLVSEEVELVLGVEVGVELLLVLELLLGNVFA